jgi:hypothetical protein
MKMAAVIKAKGHIMLGLEKPTKIRQEVTQICGIIRQRELEVKKICV